MALRSLLLTKIQNIFQKGCFSKLSLSPNSYALTSCWRLNNCLPKLYLMSMATRYSIASNGSSASSISFSAPFKQSPLMDTKRAIVVLTNYKQSSGDSSYWRCLQLMESMASLEIMMELSWGTMAWVGRSTMQQTYSSLLQTMSSMMAQQILSIISCWRCGCLASSGQALRMSMKWRQSSWFIIILGPSFITASQSSRQSMFFISWGLDVQSLQLLTTPSLTDYTFSTFSELMEQMAVVLRSSQMSSREWLPKRSSLEYLLSPLRQQMIWLQKMSLMSGLGSILQALGFPLSMDSQDFTYVLMNQLQFLQRWEASSTACLCSPAIMQIHTFPQIVSFCSQLFPQIRCRQLTERYLSMSSPRMRLWNQASTSLSELRNKAVRLSLRSFSGLYLSSCSERIYQMLWSLYWQNPLLNQSSNSFIISLWGLSFLAMFFTALIQTSRCSGTRCPAHEILNLVLASSLRMLSTALEMNLRCLMLSWVMTCWMRFMVLYWQDFQRY